MNFARHVFNIAGWYGLLVLTPMYLLERKIGQDQPPAITHPEFFYGFVGVALAAQLMFLVIARDPQKYRPLMPVGIFEKLSFFIPALILYSQRRIANSVLVMAIIDLFLAVLFAIAYLRTSATQAKSAAMR